MTRNYQTIQTCVMYILLELLYYITKVLCTSILCLFTQPIHIDSIILIFVYICVFVSYFCLFFCVYRLSPCARLINFQSSYLSVNQVCDFFLFLFLVVAVRNLSRAVHTFTLDLMSFMHAFAVI